MIFVIFTNFFCDKLQFLAFFNAHFNRYMRILQYMRHYKSIDIQRVYIQPKPQPRRLVSPQYKKQSSGKIQAVSPAQPT